MTPTLLAAKANFVDIDVPLWAWGALLVFIILLLLVDLVVFHKEAHDVKTREAAIESIVWVSIGLAFTFVVWFAFSGAAAGEYISGYLIEKSLSVDNVFVWALIFSYFKVPGKYQHRVLFWGILGALVMRGLMIGAGAALITRFAWIIYVFGGFLILTGVKMLLMHGESGDINDSRIVRLLRRLMPITERYHGARFLVRAGTPAAAAPAEPGGPVETDRVVATARKGALLATPLLLALILVEATDLIFAVDSIPAIFAITTDPFIVFTSNVFAILGLRSLYFALAGMMDRFRYLKPALAAVLVIIGTKMLAHGHLKEWLGAAFNYYVMAVVLAVIATGVITSLVVTRRDTPSPAAPTPA